MASSSSQNIDGTKTRLKDANEKRRAEEKLKLNNEIKRQRKMFAPKSVIGLRDILVKSDLQKIKLEEDVGCSSFVKKEVLETISEDSFVSCDPIVVKLEVDVGAVVKVEEILELETNEELRENNEIAEEPERFKNETDLKHDVLSTELKHSLSEVVTKLEEHNEEDKTIKLEFSAMVKLIDQLQLRLNILNNNSSTTHMDEVKSERFSTNLPSSSSQKNVTNKQIVTKSTTNHEGNDEKASGLYYKILKLQIETFSKLKDRTFVKVLPVLFPALRLNETIDFRNTCNNWYLAVNTFVTEMGHIPTWNEPPIEKLAKIYKFDGLEQLRSFTSSNRSKNYNAKVFFDNISIQSQDSVDVLKTFFNFGINIKYLKIRQELEVKFGLELSHDKIRKVMDFVKFCLQQVPNLEAFSLLISTGMDNTDGGNCWRNAVKNKKNETLKTYTFPKLEKLETLLIDFWTYTDSWCLNQFATSLVNVYSDQLKQLNIFIYKELMLNIEYMFASNLLQLTIQQNVFNKIELYCENVEKCTILEHADVLTHEDIILIQRVFPKMVCLALEFSPGGWTNFENSLWTTSTPTLTNIECLELWFCSTLFFTVLHCFPNLRYLKFISDKPREKLIGLENNDILLHVKNLFRGKNLYELDRFWKYFPNISMVTLEFISEPKEILVPKRYAYTREGYVQYCDSKISKELKSEV